MALVLSALHCCKELIRCTGGRGRLAAGCRAVIQRPNLCCVLALTSRQRPAQCAKHFLGVLALTNQGKRTNKHHPPSPSTTAKSTQATFSALGRVGLTSAVWSRMMHGVQKINIDLKLRQKHAPIFTCTAKLKGLVKLIRTCNIVQIPYAEAIRTAQCTSKK